MAPRREEEWARQVMARHLKMEVHVHDDGSANSLYDLRIGSYDQPEVAIEVTRAVDDTSIELRKIAAKYGYIDLMTINGRWHVTVLPSARLGDLQKRIPAILENLSDLAVGDPLDVNERSRNGDSIGVALNKLNVQFISRLSSEGPGRYRFNPAGYGGVGDDFGSRMAHWISEFLGDAKRSDVRKKLQMAGSVCREAFILVDLDGVPWDISSYLMDLSIEEAHVPDTEPELPPEITGVWIASEWCTPGSAGVRWDGQRWSIFDSGPLPN